MIVVAPIEMISAVAFHNSSVMIEVHESSRREVIDALEENSNYEENYCWYGSLADSTPAEVEAVYSHKDLCAEEYMFDSLCSGHTLFVWSAHTHGIEWQMVLFSEVEE